MIVWIVASLLGMATGLRIGWALVNQRSVVSGAMTVALGSLAVVAALNWPPLALLVDTALGWPNIAVCLSQMALVASAAGSFVMITSVASTRSPDATRRLAVAHYCAAALVAAVTLALFLADGRQPEMSATAYPGHNPGPAGEALDWLVPLLYVVLALSVASWVGVRLSSATRRGRALLVFSAGVALLVAASVFLASLAVGSQRLAGVGAAASLLVGAMAIVAAGALLPAVEDWFGARHELRLIEPLRREMGRRHPDIGIGARPRGPLVFRVAERLSLISDALYLEGARAQQSAPAGAARALPAGLSPADQARAVAAWIRFGAAAAFPGRAWLQQPPDCSDRDWILLIARQYRALGGGADRSQPAGAPESQPASG